MFTCSAALAALVRAIDPTALDTLVFLGDYIDRGPDSRGVLEQVIALALGASSPPLLSLTHALCSAPRALFFASLLGVPSDRLLADV